MSLTSFRRSPKRIARHVGQVRSSHRALRCRWCCEHYKTRKQSGNSVRRWLARDLRQMVAE